MYIGSPRPNTATARTTATATACRCYAGEIPTSCGCSTSTNRSWTSSTNSQTRTAGNDSQPNGSSSHVSIPQLSRYRFAPSEYAAITQYYIGWGGPADAEHAGYQDVGGKLSKTVGIEEDGKIEARARAPGRSSFLFFIATSFHFYILGSTLMLFVV